ncbi:MAG TPA: glucose-6-phosphate isomerase [Candidatus Marinimicrobia bacterium]|nr:glucose-6-phosphate isomerase [Candidatus Neomarinimicrobiota bacterium]
MILYDDTPLAQFLKKDELEKTKAEAQNALEILKSRDGAGNEFLGWLDLPFQKKVDLQAIQSVADEIRQGDNLLVCIGIGGSYLGARAVIEAIYGNRHSIRFAGHHLSPLGLKELLDELENRDFYVNVISKSGTTTEPGIAFRILKEYTEQRYGDDTQKRIITTTDANRGALLSLAKKEGYRRFVIPDDVGGRFSVLTAVGLLPILSAGIALDDILAGAIAGMNQSLENCHKNMALRYAANRIALYRSGKKIEILANFEPRLHSLTEWWKQLYGESEGKNAQGLFPAAVDLTTDLHSMGQWIQDAERSIFETFLTIGRYEHDFILKAADDDADQLNYLAGKSLSYVNQKAYEGTREAHLDGAVPSSSFSLEKLDARHIFELMMIYEVGIALSGYMAGVNPFDQPGVEAYKNNMFRLLGKPGFSS